MVTLKELFGSDPFRHITVAEDRSFPPTRVCKLGQMAGHVTGQVARQQGQDTDHGLDEFGYEWIMGWKW